jgi:hypothetical protein
MILASTEICVKSNRDVQVTILDCIRPAAQNYYWESCRNQLILVICLKTPFSPLNVPAFQFSAWESSNQFRFGWPQ